MKRMWKQIKDTMALMHEVYSEAYKYEMQRAKDEQAQRILDAHKPQKCFCGEESTMTLWGEEGDDLVLLDMCSVHGLATIRLADPSLAN